MGRKVCDFEKTFGREVTVSLRDPAEAFLLVVDFMEPVDALSWMASHKDLLSKLLLEHGVIYLNRIGLTKENVTKGVASILEENALVDSYRGGVTYRPKVDKDLFLTTNIPGSGVILLHHEMSYIDTFPMKVFFFCNHPAEHGGATPVAFSRTIKKKLDPKLFEKFRSRGVAYVRNYIAEPDPNFQYFLSWREVFEVSTKGELEDKAKKLGFQYEWIGDRLRTTNHRPATMRHPQTGEEFLFNHLIVFQSTDQPGPGLPMQRAQVASAREEERKMFRDMPPLERTYCVTWGDTGEVIEPDITEELFQCYNSNKNTVDWRSGSLMLVDNILAAHGRDQFLGKREVFAMLSKK